MATTFSHFRAIDSYARAAPHREDILQCLWRVTSSCFQGQACFYLFFLFFSFFFLELNSRYNLRSSQLLWLPRSNLDNEKYRQSYCFFTLNTSSKRTVWSQRTADETVTQKSFCTWMSRGPGSRRACISQLLRSTSPICSPCPVPSELSLPSPNFWYPAELFFCPFNVRPCGDWVDWLVLLDLYIFLLAAVKKILLFARTFRRSGR